MFLKVAVVGTHQDQDIDPVLGIQISQLSNEVVIIGLPSVQASRPYMVLILRSGRQFQLQQTGCGQDSGDEMPDLMQISWTVEYL